MCPKYYLLYNCYRYDLSIFQHIFGLLAQPSINSVTHFLSRKTQVSTAARKYFHLATVAVYTFGYAAAADPDFLCLAAYVAVSALVLVEAFR